MRLIVWNEVRCEGKMHLHCITILCPSKEAHVIAWHIECVLLNTLWGNWTHNAQAQIPCKYTIIYFELSETSLLKRYWLIDGWCCPRVSLIHVDFHPLYWWCYLTNLGKIPNCCICWWRFSLPKWWLNSSGSPRLCRRATLQNWTQVKLGKM